MLALPSDSRPEALTICFPFAGDSIGGSHHSVLGLLRQLDRDRFRPLVVTEVPGGRIARMFAEFAPVADPGANSVPVAPGQPYSLAKFTRTLTGLPARVRLLKAEQVGIVHSNDGRTHAAWGLPARLARVPLLWHHRADPSALGLRLAAPLLATRVLTVSSFSLPPRGWWSAAHKSEVVHSPFDTAISVDRADARARLLAELDLRPDTLILGYFGSLVPRKRPFVFVDAAVRLQDLIRRPVAGLMFGEAKNPAFGASLQERMAQPDARECVRLMGVRPDGASWIGGCDQLIVPAVREPFGRTLIEAMLVGTPVIAAESGGNVEALQGGLGRLVKPDDPAALAEASAELANAPHDAAALAQRARQAALQRFGEERHAERVSQIYAELAAR